MVYPNAINAYMAPKLRPLIAIAILFSPSVSVYFRNPSAADSASQAVKNGFPEWFSISGNLYFSENNKSLNDILPLLPFKPPENHSGNRFFELI
jgi:hypothetical protein